MAAVKKRTVTRRAAHEPGKKDNWEDLVRTGPGTPMGTIFRQYWHPVAESGWVAAGKAIPVQILGEKFTLYRSHSGRPYLVAPRCPHRGTALHVGWVEGEEIRCRYHGWKFDGAGQCTQMPAETTSFAEKVKIRSHPAADYAGLVFVYLGDGDAPDLPRKAEIDTATYTWSKIEMWPCNWLQAKENSFDPLHVNFTHRVNPLGDAVSQDLPKIEFKEEDWGFAVTALRPNGNRRVNETPFPNGTHINVPQPNDPKQPWIDLFAWSVPVDDEHHTLCKIYASFQTGAVADEMKRFFDGITYHVPDHHDEILYQQRLPTDNVMHLTEAQDYLTQIGQGSINERSEEWLGTSDVAIIQMRKAYRREAQIVQRTGKHKRWTNRYGPANLPPPPGVPGTVRAIVPSDVPRR